MRRNLKRMKWLVLASLVFPFHNVAFYWSPVHRTYANQTINTHFQNIFTLCFNPELLAFAITSLAPCVSSLNKKLSVSITKAKTLRTRLWPGQHRILPYILMQATWSLAVGVKEKVELRCLLTFSPEQVGRKWVVEGTRPGDGFRPAAIIKTLDQGLRRSKEKIVASWDISALAQLLSVPY